MIETNTMAAHMSAWAIPVAGFDAPATPLRPKRTAMIQKLDITVTGMPNSENTAPPRRGVEGKGAEDSAGDFPIGPSKHDAEPGLGERVLRKSPHHRGTSKHHRATSSS